MAFKDKEVCLNSIPFNRLYSIGEKGASCRPENITSKLTSDLDDISNFSEYGQTAAQFLRVTQSSLSSHRLHASPFPSPGAITLNKIKSKDDKPICLTGVCLNLYYLYLQLIVYE